MADIIIELINILGQFVEEIREFFITLSGATNILIACLAIITLISIIFWVLSESIKRVVPVTR